MVLAGWGGANIVGGTGLAVAGRGVTSSAFGQQSAAWGTINLAIAGVGWWRSRRASVELPRLRTILLLNAALDVGYLGAGAALVASGRGQDDAHAAARRGHGAAVMVQGAALLALDVAFAAVATREMRAK